MAPSTQKALIVPGPKAPWTLRTDWPVPTPAAHEVLVKVMATALNPTDWKSQVYAPWFVPGYPLVGGLDGAGIVEDVGAAVTTFAKGDRVYASISGLSAA